MSGLFGTSRPAQSSIFGAQPTTILGAPLGGSTTQSTQNQNPLASGLFGSQAQQAATQVNQTQQVPQMPALSQSQAQLSSSLWQPGRETAHQKSVPEQIKLITEKWDPTHPNCVFKYYFYNKVDEANVPFYMPQPYEDAREWEEALQNKPGPGFMPVQCRGFAQLAERLKTQRRAVGDFNTRLHQVNASLDAILSNHELETSVRAMASRRRQAVLKERCLALAAKAQVLRNRGYALSSDEDDLRIKLQALERKMQDPALGAKEEELWSRLVVLRGYADQMMKEANTSGAGDGDGLGEEVEHKAKKVLEDFGKQLLHLKREVESINEAFNAWEKERMPKTSTTPASR